MSAEPVLTSDVIGLTKTEQFSRRGFMTATAAVAAGYTLAAGPVRADVIKTETYSSNTTNIPQAAAPVGINLWCFKGTPSSNQSAIIHDFRFVPQ